MENGGHEGVGSAEDLVVPDDPNISEDGVVVAEPNTPSGTHRTPGWMVWMGMRLLECGPSKWRWPHCSGNGDGGLARG